MAKAQDGDAGAYRRLLQETGAFIRSFARARGLNAADGNDLAQDVLLTLHRTRHTYDPSQPFKPWLLTLAHRRLIDLYRRERRIRNQECALPDMLDNFADPASGSGVLVAECHDWLGRSMQALPSKQREALQLVKLNECSVAEAASRSGQTCSAIKVNVHRAIRALSAVAAAA